MPGTVENASVARQVIRKLWAENPRLNHEILDDLLLMVSELFTNAVRHSRSGRPGGRVGLVIRATGKWVRVEVIDAGSCSIPRAADRTTDEQTLEPGGWGLTLVEQHADAWGHAPHETGRVVWFEKGVK